ncbi:MAG: GNAT family N-acetyltransferase [Clostridia bacterium]|nr:GNAT family N-acetyltransferase [Clostridia bacterium]
MDNLFQHIKTAQGLYPRLFAEETKLPWGSLFYNPRNTLSIEANHGVVLDPQTDYKAVLQQATDFYGEKELPARVYFYLNSSEEAALQAAAEAMGGTLTKSPLQLLTCREPKEKNVSTPLQFVHITEWDRGINEHIIGENLHLEGILRGSMAHETYTLTVGYLFGTPVTMASLWDDGEVMRISNVMTGDAFRGCGFAGALILHMLSLAAAKGKPAYLFADNPVAIRVYERDGMTVEQPDFHLYIFAKE